MNFQNIPVDRRRVGVVLVFWCIYLVLAFFGAQPLTTSYMMHGGPSACHHIPWDGKKICGWEGMVIHEEVGMLMTNYLISDEVIILQCFWIHQAFTFSDLSRWHPGSVSV